MDAISDGRCLRGYCALMRLIAQAQGTTTLQLTNRELVAVSNALNEVCHGPDAIDDCEFQARMGVEPSEVKALLHGLPEPV